MSVTSYDEPPVEAGPESLQRLRQERDFYRSLLALGTQDDIEPFLEEALDLVIAVSGAEKGYLELRDPNDDGEDRFWWLARDFSREDVDAIRQETSRGIIAEALASGRTVHTASAVQDPRFASRTSVQRNRVAAVLCATIGADPLGVVYLQGERNGMPFDADARRLAEVFARHLAPFAARLVDLQRRRERTDATRAIRERLRLESFVGRSEAVAAVLEQLALVAPLDVHVLLTGPSGSGKTALAAAIAANGPRAGAPFVELNCAAIPENLVESELFGALKGSHSMAARDVEGKVAAAEGGTLFLDEVAELSLASQAKLLHLIQTKRYFPLGATQPRTADIRIIAATNVELEEAVARKRFREDLMYRLQVLPIRMPSLAQRRDDIVLLAEHFADRVCRSHGLAPVGLSNGASHALREAEWPGNVRQLANVVQAGVIRAHGQKAEAMRVEHLFPDRAPEEGADDAPTYAEATRRFQRGLLLDTLGEVGWNVSETARRLGLARSHVYNLLESFGIRRSD